MLLNIGVETQNRRMVSDNSLTTFVPVDNYQSRTSQHIGKAKTWAGSNKICFTEYGQTNRAGSASDETAYNDAFVFGLHRMAADNASWTIWADGVWGAYYNVATVNRSTGDNYSVLDAAQPRFNDSVDFRGVNWAELEFGGGPGWFAGPSVAQLTRYAGYGANVVRLPIASIYLQTSDGAVLDSSYMTLIETSINNIEDAGMKCILDIHDYCKYRGTNITTGSQAETYYHDMIDKLLNYSISDGNAGSVLLKNHTGLWGLEIMNEPANAPSTTAWETIAQDTVTYIRDTIGWSGELLVAIGSYSGVHSVDSYHPSGPFITDSANNFRYVFHYYPNSIGVHGSWDGTFSYKFNTADAATNAFSSKENTAIDDLAFNGDGSGTGWAITSPDGTNEYLGWDFGSGKQYAIWQYQIDNNNINNPTAWVLEYSNDNTNWTTLHTVTGESAWNEFGENRTYTPTTHPPLARYWRLRFTAHNSVGIRIGEWKCSATPKYSEENDSASSFTIADGTFSY